VHFYTETPGDIISKQLHPNGALYLYTVLKDGKPANGWSSKKYYPGGKLEEEENYNNDLLIEKISYDENGSITKHKIWNNRLKQLINKPAQPKLPKHNVVTGVARLSDYLEQLPAISEFINAEYNKDSLLQSYDEGGITDPGDTKWTMKGEQMRFTIYWDHNEVSHQWHCHCDTEELYWKARDFLKEKI
jgi:hypothetical protein